MSSEYGKINGHLVNMVRWPAIKSVCLLLDVCQRVFAIVNMFLFRLKHMDMEVTIHVLI